MQALLSLDVSVRLLFVYFVNRTLKRGGYLYCRGLYVFLLLFYTHNIVLLLLTILALVFEEQTQVCMNLFYLLVFGE